MCCTRPIRAILHVVNLDIGLTVLTAFPMLASLPRFHHVYILFDFDPSRQPIGSLYSKYGNNGDHVTHAAPWPQAQSNFKCGLTASTNVVPLPQRPLRISV